MAENPQVTQASAIAADEVMCFLSRDEPMSTLDKQEEIRKLIAARMATLMPKIKPARRFTIDRKGKNEQEQPDLDPE